MIKTILTVWNREIVYKMINSAEPKNLSQNFRTFLMSNLQTYRLNSAISMFTVISNSVNPLTWPFSIIFNPPPKTEHLRSSTMHNILKYYYYYYNNKIGKILEKKFFSGKFEISFITIILNIFKIISTG